MEQQQQHVVSAILPAQTLLNVIIGPSSPLAPRLPLLEKTLRVRTAEDLLKIPRAELRCVLPGTDAELQSLLHEVSIHLCPAPLSVLALARDPTYTHKLGLGCPVLDACLGGGLLPRHITEVAGEAGSGKTQICLQLALQVQLPVEHGGLGGGAIYIGTEGNFPQRRLDQLHEAFSSKHAAHLPRGHDLRDNIYIKSVSSIDQLFRSMIQQVPPLVQQRNVRLVIIDSIAALLRYEYGTGASQLIERSKVIFSQANQLKQIADQLQVAVVVVNQVSDRIDDSRTNMTDIVQHKKRVVPALGLVWSNCINTRILLSKTDFLYRGRVSSSTFSNASVAPAEEPNLKKRRVGRGGDKELAVGIREMKVVFSPYLPNNSCSFIIEGDGVRGVDD